jgi:purine-binding chemotaxis protein CheW
MTTTGQTQHLTFRIANEQYALEILRVREIVEMPPITQVPATPLAIRGVVNLRGTVVPVIDPGVRFGVGARPITRWTCIVFVEIDASGLPMTIGLLVDSIGHVLEFGPDAVEPVPPFGTEIPLEFLRGLARVGRKFVHLLDVDRVLSMSELVAAKSLVPVDAPPASAGPRANGEAAP